MGKNNQTKERILAAALDEFACHGFAGTRVDQIARAAGVNKAMIYYHFANKEELFNELFRQEMEQLKLELGEVLGRNTGSAEGKMQATRQVLEYVERKEKYLRVLMSGSLLDQSLLPHFFQLLDFTTSAGLDLAQKAGQAEQESNEHTLLDELFTGLLPLIGFVLLGKGLQAYYGWDKETLTERFITGWLSQHGGY